MNKARKKYIESCGISQLKEVVLGGYKQKIAIEGRRKNLPVVICLHGGPGSPVPFSVGCRGMFPDFTDKAVMVYWDQLGCGINNFPVDDSFTIESFADMTVDLIGEIKSLFPENGLYLFDVSWGSMPSAAGMDEVLSGILKYIEC